MPLAVYALPLRQSESLLMRGFRAPTKYIAALQTSLGQISCQARGRSIVFFA